ncbi:Cytochrome P450 CYP4/CYP19/CYP26 subfamilies [Ceraceosorus bombacis]|uniref:Cytochrome P450 CYP4/CYP19/CYP26 subfamilies n=1 Tax=Ceraceosorus bombacis TaxID=401625 RepID=A0A0P1BNU2_9BASI|nr:Cytochrome P450 CYP4/CYP19/CYP26 subfamilies [Ceraceosorus bombacis]
MGRIPHAEIDSLVTYEKYAPNAARRRIYNSLFTKSYFLTDSGTARLEGVLARNREALYKAVNKLIDAELAQQERSTPIDFIHYARGIGASVVAAHLFGDGYVIQNFSLDELAVTAPGLVEGALSDCNFANAMPAVHSLAKMAKNITNNFPLPAWIGEHPKYGQFLKLKTSNLWSRSQRHGERPQLIAEVSTERCIVSKLHKAGCDEDMILNEIGSQLVAGTDTIASTASSTVHLLLEHPVILDALKQELETTFPDGLLSLESLDTCSFLNLCIKESTRFIPAGPGPFPRVVPEAGLQLSDGRWLPPGTLVFVAAGVSNMDPEIYDKPEIFDPLRWKNATREMEASLLTFSSGPRHTHDDMHNIVETLTMRPASGVYRLELIPKSRG